MFDQHHVSEGLPDEFIMVSPCRIWFELLMGERSLQSSPIVPAWRRKKRRLEGHSTFMNCTVIAVISLKSSFI